MFDVVMELLVLEFPSNSNRSTGSDNMLFLCRAAQNEPSVVSADN